MSELRITPVQVPVSQARGVDEMGFAGQPSYPGQPDFGASMGFPGQPGAFAAPTPTPRSYAAAASGGALAAAYLIDVVCFAVLTALAWWVYPSLPVVVIVACELWIIATFIRARSGRTPGAFAMQIAAISTQPTPSERGMEFDRAPGLGRQSAHSFIMLLLHATVVGPVITWLLLEMAKPGLIACVAWATSIFARAVLVLLRLILPRVKLRQARPHLAQLLRLPLLISGLGLLLLPRPRLAQLLRLRPLRWLRRRLRPSRLLRP